MVHSFAGELWGVEKGIECHELINIDIGTIWQGSIL